MELSEVLRLIEQDFRASLPEGVKYTAERPDGVEVKHWTLSFAFDEAMGPEEFRNRYLKPAAKVLALGAKQRELKACGDLEFSVVVGVKAIGW